MSTLVKTTNESSNSLTIISSDSSADIIRELESQKEEVQPVLDFYEKLVKGWQGRVLRAEQALTDPGNQSESQQKVFNELLQFALREMETHLPVYNEVKVMKEQLDEKIQEFKLMSVKKTLTPSTHKPVELDFKQAKELLYKADALIELRKEQD